MEVFGNVLLLLNFDGPEAFDSFLFLGGWSMVVAFMWVGFANTEGEEGEREEFERFGCGGGVSDSGQEGVLLCGSFGIS